VNGVSNTRMGHKKAAFHSTKPTPRLGGKHSPLIIPTLIDGNPSIKPPKTRPLTAFENSRIHPVWLGGESTGCEQRQQRILTA